MSEEPSEKAGEKTAEDENVVEYILEDLGPISSSENIRENPETAIDNAPAGLDKPMATDQDETRSPVFKKLAAVELPELPSENRAKLLMQSPNRLYLYWTIRKNPFQTLTHALGPQTGVYTLVARLIDLDREREELHRVDTEGNWWFNVDADTRYRAEIGFYAPNRPFVRVIFSNTVQTPRRSPSPHSADSAEWRITSHAFAEILDASGFSRDAFDAAVAGDDRPASDEAARYAAARIFDIPADGFSGVGSDEIRFALSALAAGVSLEQLRWQIGPTLFAILQARMPKLTDADALAQMQAEFSNADFTDFEERPWPSVFGASLIGFPKRLRRGPISGKPAPLSSWSLSSRV